MIELKYKPTTLVIDQVIACNQECGFCWRMDRNAVANVAKQVPWKVLPFDMYAGIVGACTEVKSLIRISLCGPLGEPALVPDLCERGRLARETGKYTNGVLINTNGSELHRHDPVALLESFTEINVSLDAPDPVTYTAIHRKVGHWERVVENLARLQEAKRRRRNVNDANLRVRFTECEANRDKWPEFSRWMAGRADSVIHVKAHSFIDALPHLGNSMGAVLCNQPWRSVNFNVRGELTTCCVNHHLEPTFGTLDQAPLKDLWEGEAFETWRQERHEGICKGCSGLGPQSQSVSNPFQEDYAARAEMIREIGEWRYYNEARA